MTDVKLLARWTGWCDPCEIERPLLLTETGDRGLRAWLRGVGPEDRVLTLTCACCGEWQLVPHDEADDPEVAVPQLPGTRMTTPPVPASQPGTTAMPPAERTTRKAAKNAPQAPPAHPTPAHPTAARPAAPEAALLALPPLTAVRPIGVRAVRLAGPDRDVVGRAVAPAPPGPVAVPRPRSVLSLESGPDRATLELLAEGLDLISLAS